MDPADPALIDELSQAQTAGARLITETSGRLERGMTPMDVGKLVHDLAAENQTPLDSPAVVGFGLNGATRSRLLPDTSRLEAATLVSIDLRPRVGRAVGDYGRTVIFGDSGRLWFYQRIARRVYAAFLAGLDGCRTEQDAWQLAWSCAYREGCRLIGSGASVGHHVAIPWPHRSALVTEVLLRRERLEHVVRAALPFGMASPKLKGPWAMEPRFVVDRHQFAFEDVFDFRDGQARLLGEPPLPAENAG